MEIKEQMKNNKKVQIGIVIGIIMILLLMMPIFYVQTIEVEHNHFYSKEEIIAASGIQKSHLLDLNYLTAKKKLKDLPYIADVKMSYQWKGRIVIAVTEKAPYAYVDFNGTYLCLNEQGQVIEQTQKCYHEVPVVEGLEFTAFKSNETLPISNEDTWFAVQQVIDYLDKHDYTKKVNKIDVHNIEEIHLYVDKLDVIMGDIVDFDKKIETLMQIHDKEGYTMGSLDLSVITTKQEAYLKPIT